MPTLYIIGTPIGNLEDITLRAIRILKEVDVIYCEDTRVTKKLLSRYEINTPLRRLDAHTEKARTKEVIDRLVEGQSVAFVTDAGTPGISDPGQRLVESVRNASENLEDTFLIEVIPGPSALTAALSISGISADQFVFFGFLPHKKGRQTLLKEIATIKRTVVVYESPHRILKLLGELSQCIGDREVVVARELTKKFEEVQRGTAEKIKGIFEKDKSTVKGEFVVIISGQ
ncbi:MAG: 16S rRNA (cytidine(1402)-2'-O)-methyltransferase [Planctomycetes bacterium]|nr:16S rRNA (cytidine(1402)-2'-O)-methyltransferase [Planctomycetota bacterium]